MCVIIFYFLLYFLATITQQGIAKLAEKEEELQFLKMEVLPDTLFHSLSIFFLSLSQLARLQREVKINRDQLPEKEELERELTLHQNMVKEHHVLVLVHVHTVVLILVNSLMQFM